MLTTVEATKMAYIMALVGVPGLRRYSHGLGPVDTAMYMEDACTRAGPEPSANRLSYLEPQSAIQCRIYPRTRSQG